MSNVTRMPNVSPQNWPQANWSGSWPPSCSCGCNPCQCGGGFGGLMQCWQELSQFQQFLQCMLSQAGPIPLQGVTDGSNAAAGNIGEYIILTGTVAYAAYPTNTTAVVSIGVLPPGDWSITANMQSSSLVGTSSFHLTPVPAGMSNAMWGVAVSFTSAGVSEQNISINAQAARGNFSVPTLLAFTVNIGQGAESALPAGTATLVVEARRIR